MKALVLQNNKQIGVIDIEKLHGPKGDTPSVDELRVLVREAMPSADELRGPKGDSPSTDELKGLIRSTLPKEELRGDKGDSPSKDELRSLIREAMPSADELRGPAPTREEILAVCPKPEELRPSRTELQFLIHEALPPVSELQGEDGAPFEFPKGEEGFVWTWTQGGAQWSNQHQGPGYRVRLNTIESRIAVLEEGGGGGGFNQAQIEEFARDAVAAAFEAGQVTSPQGVIFSSDDGLDEFYIGLNFVSGSNINPNFDGGSGEWSWTLDNLNGFDTDSLSEGATNLYYTDERAQGAISFIDSGAIAWSYIGGAATADVIDNSISNTKLRTSVRRSVVGRSAGSDGNVADIQASVGDFVLISGATLSWGKVNGLHISNNAIASSHIVDAAVTFAKIQDIPALSLIGLGPGSAGVPTSITPTFGLAMLGTDLYCTISQYTDAMADARVVAGIVGKANSSDVSSANATFALSGDVAGTYFTIVNGNSKASSSDVSSANATFAKSGDVAGTYFTITNAAAKANSSDVSSANATFAKSSDVSSFMNTMWTNVVLGSIFGINSTTVTSITGMNFTPVANATYEFEARLMLRATVASNAPRAGLFWPTGMTDGVATIREPITATTQRITRGNINANMQSAVGSFPNSTQSYLTEINGIVQAGGSPSGVLQIGLSCTAANTVTCRAGSNLRYRRIA